MSNQCCRSVVAMVVILGACCASNSVARGRPSESRNCPPPGTFVPLAKVTSSAFAGDYVGCHVRTTASFLLSGKGGLVGGDIKGFAIFQVVPPGQAGTRNPLSGAMQGTWTYVRNDRSDLIFDLKSGESIEMIGGSVFVGDRRFGQVAFVADTVWRSPAPVDSTQTMAAPHDTATAK
jgi:hypothetical protein